MKLTIVAKSTYMGFPMFTLKVNYINTVIQWKVRNCDIIIKIGIKYLESGFFLLLL